MNHPKAMSITVTSIMLATALAYAQPATPPPPAEAAAPAAPPAAAPEPPPPPPKPATPPPPIANKFQFTIYGFGQLDIIHDSTSVLPEGAGQTVLPRDPTLQPMPTPAQASAAAVGPAVTPRTTMFGNNSRFGFRLNAPEMNGVKAMTQIEADFMGNTANANESAQNNRNLRLRHAFVKMESDIFDVTAGYTWDVFGGAVVPFLGAGMAFHGLLGEIFHRNPQLRISKTIKTDPLNVELRVAAVRPVQAAGEIPDLQGALRLVLNNWKTVHSFGSGLPAVDGLTLEFSGMYRFFKLNEFSATPASFVKKNGWGASVNAWLPIIPATKENQANALGVSVEAATGVGIGDMWGINGGAGAFPNVTDAVAAMPMAMPPVAASAAVPYASNIDAGIVAFNRATGEFMLPKWTSVVVNLQYRPPFEDGRVVLSSNHSYIFSDNIADLAAMGTGYTAANLWKSGIRNDVSLSYTFYPAVVVGAMYETIQHKYVTVVNDSDKSVRNHRIHFSILFYF